MSDDEFCQWREGIKFDFPKPKWRWYVFGGRDTKWIPMLVEIVDSRLWHRILTRIVLRSQWEKLP